MASDREYLEFILEQLAELDGVRARAMMGAVSYTHLRAHET